MEKVTTIEQLAKAVSGLGPHFKKAAAHHKAVSDAHAALAEVHKAHGAFVKAKVDAMDDGDAHKTYFGKVAEHHAAKMAHHLTKASLHKAHAEHLDGLGDSFTGEEQKTVKVVPVGADPNANRAAGEGVAGMIEKTTTALVTKALEALDSDPLIAERIQKLVLDRVDAALADKVRPDGVKGVLSSRPTLVPRPGNGPVIETKDVPAELRELVEA